MPGKLRRTCLAAVLLATMSAKAHATFHLWEVVEVYRSPDGSVQYVELFSAVSGQEFLAEEELVSTNNDGSDRVVYVFPDNSPAPTNDRHLLIATENLEARTGLAPDFILPADFLDPEGGTVILVGADSLEHSAFSDDDSQSQGEAGTSPATPTNFAGETTSLGALSRTLAAAILPSSRSVTVGDSATAFATLINPNAEPVADCRIALLDGAIGMFSFQTTNPLTNTLTGTPNTAVNIDAGDFRSFVIAVTPSSALAPAAVAFDFRCSGGATAQPIAGVSDLLLSASSSPTADIIALTRTAGADGIVNLDAETGNGAFAAATFNVGAAAEITATVVGSDSGLPLLLNLCENDPITAACTNPLSPAAAVNLPLGPGASATFSVFVSSTEPVAFDPALRRVFIRFTDSSGALRGSSSVALRTAVQ